MKCHEEVLSLVPMIPPKRFDIFPPDRRMLRRSNNTCHLSIYCMQVVILIHFLHMLSCHKSLLAFHLTTSWYKASCGKTRWMAWQGAIIAAGSITAYYLYK